MSFETLKFGLVAVVAVIVAVIALRLLGRFLSWIERAEIARQQAEAADARKKKNAAAPAPAVEAGVPADHVAAIAAALACYGYRVVHIADAAGGKAWAAEGRWIHQTSHRPH
jgi:hypothetical protein